MKHLLLFGLLVASATFGMAQNTVGTIEYEPDLAQDGYNMVIPLFGNGATLVDMCGEVVHSWTSEDSVRNSTWSYLQDNGDIVMTLREANVANDVIWTGGGGGIIERRTWDNDLVWSYTLNDSLYRLHHDIQVMDNGNVLALVWELKDSLEYVAAGGDMSLIDDVLWSEVIFELEPNGSGGADVVWEWHAWDHLVQDFDENKPNYGVIADNPQKINLNSNSPQGQQPLADWLHMNSIHFNPVFGQIMVSVPNLNEVWIIDYAGGAEGSIIWRWGNPAAYDRGTADDQKLFFQHDARWAYEGIGLSDPNFGKVTVFNNRVPDAEAPGGYHSEAVILEPVYDFYENEYTMDLTTGTFLPLDFDAVYAAPNPADLASNITSNYQILPEGHSLIGEGNQGEAIELDENNEVVWRYKIPLTSTGVNLPQPVAQGTVLNPMQNLMFRMERFASDFPGFAGQDLTPMGVIELDPTPLSGCSPAEGCMDMLACNYDSLAVVAGPCSYFEASYGESLEFVLGTLDLESGCNGGYAVSESLPVTLAATDSGMTWVFEPEVAQILIDNGFGIVVDDLTTQSLSLCGTDMNVMDAAGNDYTLTYDNTGYINMTYFGYLAPAENFGYGCGFEFACNYDPCSLYDFSLCEFLTVDVASTPDDGTGNGTASASASGGVEPYEYVWYAGDDEEPFSFEGNVDSLATGDYSVLAVDSTGCTGSFDFFIDYTSNVVDAKFLISVFPNPVSDVLRVQIQTEGAGELTLIDMNGRQILAKTVRNEMTDLDLSELPAGTYIMQYHNDSSVLTRQIQVLR